MLNGLWLWTARPVFLDLFNYWKKIFAVAFGMGVVSGIVMNYQFGTNWSVFADKAGPLKARRPNGSPGPRSGNRWVSDHCVRPARLATARGQDGQDDPAEPFHWPLSLAESC